MQVEFEWGLLSWSLPAAVYWETQWKQVTPTEMWCCPVLVLGLLCFKWYVYLSPRITRG